MSEELYDKILSTASHGESKLHIRLKHWIAKQYNRIIPLDKIEFEKRLSGNNSYDCTLPDVFINNDSGNIAIYCETELRGSQLHIKFVEKSLPIIRKYAMKTIVIFPQNIELSSSNQWTFVQELFEEHGVEVALAPFDSRCKNNLHIEIEFELANKLLMEKNKIMPTKSMPRFIEYMFNKLYYEKHP